MRDHPRRGDLQIDESEAFQRRSWVAERVGWVVVALLLAAALAGLFGGGPLSASEARVAGDALVVRYERFGRAQAPLPLRVSVGPGNVRPDGTLRIWISRQYINEFRVEQVVPQPREVVSEPERLVYLFPARGSGGNTEVVFYLQPQSVGRMAARVGLEGGPETAFTQLVFP